MSARKFCFIRLFEKHKQYEECQQKCSDQSDRIDDLNTLISDLQSALEDKSAEVERLESELEKTQNNWDNDKERLEGDIQGLNVSEVLQKKIYLSLCMRKPTIWVPTRSDTNQAVQSQKIIRGWKFCIYKVEELFYLCSENKGADQLRSYCEADLRLCFRLCRLLVFPCTGSFSIKCTLFTHLNSSSIIMLVMQLFTCSLLCLVWRISSHCCLPLAHK